MTSSPARISKTRKIDVALATPVHRSFRVDQVAGMFDLAIEEKARQQFTAEVPAAGEDWRIGVIVGPSGSGKTSIARAAFGKHLYTGFRWPKDKAVVDGFGERLSIKEVTHMLTAVGFSSPPSWVKPFQVLSNGEQFRCNLARALLSIGKLVAYDEFTSVVDRTVAKIGSAAVSKALRKGRIAKQFVAVTCHYDVVEWLEPDWVLDMASCQLARGCLQRPTITIEVAPVHRSAWVLFRRHHYLSGEISVGARCFAAFIDQQPVAFSAWLNYITKGRRPRDMREHRTVVLPDYQGIGIGNRLSEFCASIWTGLGGRAFSTTGHPAMIGYRSASANWRRIRLGMVRPTSSGGMFRKTSADKYAGSSCKRITGGFQYCGPAMPRARAREFAAECTTTMQVWHIVRRHPGCRRAHSRSAPTYPLRACGAPWKN